MREASAFLDQAQSFFEAAQSREPSFTPLLFYYSFLNLAKAFILAKDLTTTLDRARHGLMDERGAGATELEAAQVAVKNPGGQINVFPLFARALGYNPPTHNKLEDVCGPRVAGEFCVDSLVAAIGLSLDEVGKPAPVSVYEDGLVDHALTPVHRPGGFARGTLPVVIALQVDEHDVFAQRGEIGRLVRVSFTADQLGVRVVAERPLQLVTRDAELELSQVLAGEEVPKVGRREGQIPVLLPHSRIVTCKHMGVKRSRDLTG